MLGMSLLLFLSPLPAAEPATPSPLSARLMPLIEAHQGKVAVAVKHLTSGESFTYHENDVMPTASLIKFPVMVEALRQAEAGRIDLSATVTLQDEDSEDKVTYTIVGDTEADLKNGKISISSPIARALIGKTKGESVDVTTPKGTRTLEVLKVAWK